MAKSRKVSSISKEFDGKEVQGKLIERSGLLGSKVKKEVFKFPGGGRHVEKTRTNKNGNVISRSSKDTKINPKSSGVKEWIDAHDPKSPNYKGMQFNSNMKKGGILKKIAKKK
jgi:hypothetical protein